MDCVIIGGGPAGLTAAIYLQRFRRKVRLFDAGGSRASLIPLSHNYPGFPEGVNGIELLQRLREQALRYGAEIEHGIVERLERQADGGLAAHLAGRTIVARTMLLATGTLDIEPDLPNLPDAIRQGYLRHCPICDGYEVIDQNVAVIGNDTHGVEEALFLRTYTDRITLLTLGSETKLSDEHRRQLKEAGVAIVEQRAIEIDMRDKRIHALHMADRSVLQFDTMYSALGCRVRSDLARQIGAECDDKNDLIVSKAMQTSVENLYAAGDVVRGLNQICVAAGHAAIAATAIHHRLRAIKP
jgi:thioredoxin reductase (NADPH)